MNMPDPNKQNTSWWISSLAISVVCCAILFVVFAGYLVDVKENMATTRIRFDTIDQRLNVMTSEVENLYHRNSVQQIQVMPSSAPVSVPAASFAPSGMPTITPPTAPAATPATEPAAAAAPVTAAPAEIPAR